MSRGFAGLSCGPLCEPSRLCDLGSAGGLAVAWVRLESSFHQSPLVLSLSNRALALYAAALMWSAHHGTSGQVRYLSAVRPLSSPRALRLAAQELVRAGLFVEQGQGWQISDFDRRVVVRRRQLRPEVRARVLASGMCARCGSTDDLTVDHVVPVSRGGSDDIDNLRALCLRCNSSKGAR